MASRLIGGALALVVVLSGCAGDFSGVSLEPPAPSCTPGTAAPGETYIAGDEAAGTAVELTADVCFDLQTLTGIGTAMIDDAEYQAVVAACRSMGVEPELNRIFGHGVLQVGPVITGIDDSYGWVGGLCAYTFNPDDIATLYPGDPSAGYTRIIFDLTDTDGSYPLADYLSLSWYQYLLAHGNVCDELPGYGIQGCVIDSLPDGDIYSVIVQGEGGEIIRILTLYPDSLRAEQLEVDELLPGWVNAALVAASTLG